MIIRLKNFINNIAYLNAGNDGLFIVDFSDVENPTLLGSLTEYPDKGYNHSGWFLYFFFWLFMIVVSIKNILIGLFQ